MKNNIKFLTIALLMSVGLTSAQVGVGTTSPNVSSVLDVSSTTKGLLIPRMTTTERNLIATPAKGLQVYDTTTNTNWYYNGTIWVNMLSNEIRSKWTNDSANTQVKLTNLSDGATVRPADQAFVVKDNGNVGISNVAPLSLLDVGKNGTEGLLVTASNLGNQPDLSSLGGATGNLKLIIGWNRSGGGGEQSFINTTKTKNAVLNGGFDFYNLNNTGGTTTRLGVLNPNGLTIDNISNGFNTDDILTKSAAGLIRKVSAESVRSKFTNKNTNTHIALTSLSNGTTTRSGDNLFVITDSGNLGIGTENPTFSIQTRISTAIADVVNSKQNLFSLNARSSSDSGNNTGTIEFTQRRHTAGTSWDGTNTRIQKLTDIMTQSFIDFGIDGVINNGLGFGFNNATNMVLNQNGQLGLGTVQPTVKLDVVGYLKVAGADTFGDATPTPGMIRYNSGTDKFQGYVADSDSVTAGAQPGWVNLN